MRTRFLRQVLPLQEKLFKPILPEKSRAVLGKPVVAPYALMGTKSWPIMLLRLALTGNVILMENHGILTVGENLLQAYDRMEVLEAAAKMTFITSFLAVGKNFLILN